MKQRQQMILAARVISMLFTPFYLPIVGLIALFTFSYMSIFPWAYKLQVLIMVYLFTILLPSLMIHFYRRYQGWNLIELGQRERRMVPYILSIVCYFTCIYVMERLHMPHFMISIVIAALMVQIVCALINVWWKISTHTAAIGGVGGALFAFAESGVQSCLVAVCHLYHSWYLRYLPHGSPPTHALTSYRRILGRLHLCGCCYIVYIMSKYRNNEEI